MQKIFMVEIAFMCNDNLFIVVINFLESSLLEHLSVKDDCYINLYHVFVTVIIFLS